MIVSLQYFYRLLSVALLYTQQIGTGGERMYSK